jgi:hypothetical protein
MPDSSSTLLWSLQSRSDTMQCVVRLLPRVIQGKVLLNGQSWYFRLFTHDDELHLWATGIREDYEQKGWIDLGSTERKEMLH